MLKQKPAHFGIKKQFTELQKYIRAKQYARKGCNIFNNYCLTFEKYFIQFGNIKNGIDENLRLIPHEKNVFVKEFKQFLNHFTAIIKDVSNYQVDCLTEIRTSGQYPVEEVCEYLVQNLQESIKFQNTFKEKQDNLNQLTEQLGKNYELVKKETEEAAVMYNKKYIQQKQSNIQSDIEQLKRLNSEMEKELEELTSNSRQFENNVDTFRRKLVSNKYHFLKKVLEMSKNAEENLTELLVLLFQCVHTRYEQFSKLMKSTSGLSDSNNPKKLRKTYKNIDLFHQDAMISQIHSATKQYFFSIDSLISVLTRMSDSLTVIQQNLKNQMQKNKKELHENLNQFYELEQNPLKTVTQCLSLYETFSMRLLNTTDQLIIKTQDLKKLKQNVKKHSEITLSLLKLSPNRNKAMELNTSNQGANTKQIDELFQLMSFQFVNAILQKIYKIYKDALADLRHSFNDKCYKKKKVDIQDSMEISYIEQSIVFIDKKPDRKQGWLWKDYKDPTYNYLYPELLISEIEKFFSKCKNEQQEENKDIQSFPCTLIKKKNSKKGALKIRQKYLHFVSNDNSEHIKIPINEINSVSISIKILEKLLVLSTICGDINFGGVYDLQTAVQTIKKYIEEAENNDDGKKAHQHIRVELTSEQINSIQVKRQKIMSIIQKTENMTLIKEQQFENITIDHFYQLIYSDKNIIIRGKQQPTFMGYYSKKTKNTDYQTTKYDPPGPKFYTGDQTTTFVNCPDFSTRIVQYIHPLAQIMFIPLPKTCQIKQKCKIFWISHEQFQYAFDSSSVGVPFAENFTFRSVHSVKKTQNGVKLAVFLKFVVLKQFTMKSVVQRSAMAQGNEAVVELFNEIKKVVKSALKSHSKSENAKDEQEQQKQQEKKVQDSQLLKLKKQNKLLIIGAAVFIILSILLQLIF